MHQVFDDNSLSIGNTPLVKLNTNTPANIFAKLESRNPANCVKCRIGASMIWDAEERGILTKNKTLIEPTSGNTGIALAFVAAARGYSLVLTMPASMSLERRQLMKAMGAELILTEASLGMKGAIEKANQLVAEAPDNYVMLQQFSNPANPKIHETTTGPEIWRDLDGNVDVLVSGVGTGGTITGISRYIKQTQKHALVSVAVEPKDSPVISQTLANEAPTPSPHKIQGIGAGFVPENLDLSVIDRVEQVTNQEAIDTAKRLMKHEGILAGISSGAAASVAFKLAGLSEFNGKNIVVILPDSCERYLSSALFEGEFTEKETVQ